MNAQPGRWAQATFSSFRRSQGGDGSHGGGWRLGPALAATEAETTWLRSHAPTRLVPVEAFDDFIGQEAIDHLPRRLEYRPRAIGNTDAYMHSVPAGKDATGRPGNVFTHALFDRAPDDLGAVTYPIELFGSLQWLTPFRAAAVNAAALEHSGEFAAGPLDPVMAWMMVDTMLGNRAGALYALQRAVETSPAVLITQNTQEAAFWLYALSLTASPSEARRIGFSTFDRAETLEPRAGCISCVPAKDRPRLRVHCPIVDVNDSTTYADPTTPWNELTAAVFEPGRDIARIISTLRRTDASGDSFGVGLAALILDAPIMPAPQSFPPQVRSLAAGLTSYRPPSVFDNPLSVAAAELPATARIEPADTARIERMLDTVALLPLGEIPRGELCFRWLEYAARAGTFGQAVWEKAAECDALFAYLHQGAAGGEWACAPLLRAAWLHRYRLDGPRATQWFSAPGRTIHPRVAAQLGFAQAPEQQLQLTEIAARIFGPGSHKATPAEYARLYQGMAELQRRGGYQILRDTDQLCQLWEQVGEGLQETGYQQWYKEHKQGFDLIQELGEPMHLVVPKLATAAMRYRLLHFPTTLRTCPSSRAVMLKLVCVLLPFSLVAPIFSANAHVEAAIRELLLGTLVSGFGWESNPMTAAELERVIGQAHQEYLRASANHSNMCSAASKLARLTRDYANKLRHAPEVRVAINQVAAGILRLQGEELCK